jgi:hypothetical protein
MNIRAALTTLVLLTSEWLAACSTPLTNDELLLRVQLPPNSCSISCPARDGQPVVGVTCDAPATPLCLCRDDARPEAACEAP